MDTGDSACKLCPISGICHEKLRPETDAGSTDVANPWGCRHITCPIGEAHAKYEIKKMQSGHDSTRYVLFDSPQKRGLTRRVCIETGCIESSQDGEWYLTGQRIKLR